MRIQPFVCLPVVACAALAADQTAIELERITVEAFRRDYTAPVTSSGLGFEADPADTPLTLVSIPMDILTDQQVNNVEDALRNVSGVSKFKQGNGGEEKFSIRGFDAAQSLYKDGARINNAFNATNIATTETATIERYDVLKGPSAILYGQGEPGGIINYVTKKPLFGRTYRSAEVIAGNHDYFRSELDLTGPIHNAQDTLAYRLVASWEDSGSHRDYTARDRKLLAPSFSWRPFNDTTFTFQYERIDDRYTQDRGQILDGNTADGFAYTGRLDSSQFFGVPGWNERTTSDFERFRLLAEHRFSSRSVLSLNASTTRVDKTLYDSSPRFIGDTTIDAEGYALIRPNAQGGKGGSDTIALRHQFEFLQTDAVRHRLLALVDYETIDNDGWSANAIDSSGNRVNGVRYNLATREYLGVPAGGMELGPKSAGVQTDTRQLGVSLQDLISFGETWHLLLGGRYTEFNDDDADAQFEAFTPRVGLVYRASPNTSYYASWSEGFVPTTYTGLNPVTGNGIGGPALDPETSEQFEVGARWLAFDGRLTLNASLFDLAKNDILAVDAAAIDLPFDQWWYTPLGRTRTRGFDFQAVGKVTSALRLIGGYAYLDNELERVSPEFPNQAGNVMAGIPLHSGNVWAVYEFQAGPARGLGLGLGAFAQSKVYASSENRAIYSSWIQFDAMAYYKRDNWKLQLNVRNFTDEEYNLAQAWTTDDAFAAIRVGTSTPLTVTASVALEF